MLNADMKTERSSHIFTFFTKSNILKHVFFLFGYKGGNMILNVTNPTCLSDYNFIIEKQKIIIELSSF